MEDEAPKKRRWPFVLGCLVVLIVAAASGLKAANRSEYSFLNDFAPTRVVDPGGIVDIPTPMSDYRCEVFYYDRVNASRVLTEMRRRLTQEAGFKVTDGFSGGSKSVSASFMKTRLGTFGAAFTNEQPMLDMLWDSGHIPPIDPGGGVVVVIRGPTWFEEKWAATKKFLHLK